MTAESGEAEARDEKTERRRRDRERQQSDTDPTTGSLTQRERSDVSEHRRLSSVTVYAILYAEGEEELGRPVNSLWWSGLAAGIAISTSLLVEAILYHVFEDHPRREFIAYFGYSAGFIIVILSRLQLFTENTILVILPLFGDFSGHRLWCTARLWTVVLVANLVGTFTTAFVTIYFNTTSPEYVASMIELSQKAAEKQGMEALLLGIPAGFFIASLVWLLPSSKGFEIFTVTFIAWLIAAGGFTHVIVGSSKIFMAVLGGELPFFEGVVWNLLPTLVGNIIGGTGLFSLLVYAQVSQEM